MEFCSKALEIHLNRTEWQTDWDYRPERYDKAGSGHVGLENLGCTCYMNSLLQQLFMEPQFRHRLLSIESTDEEKEKTPLYQLQSVFAHLQESAMKYATTADFCKVFKVDGEPVRVEMQQDVDEFFSMLFDRLEGWIKPTPQKNMINELYGGEVVNQIISSDCSHTIERTEPFLTLSVEVKGKFTLASALDLFVQGDMLEGDNKYHCGSCESKVTAMKRCCINKLPRNLIVHLKRFDFDLELMRRNKINQFCEFPPKLSLEPYTKEGLARRECKDKDNLPELPHPLEYYDYELTGVLIHTGTTDSGHYYSFIKDRQNGRWCQFNDSHVSPFNAQSIPEQCYGGQFTTSVLDPIQKQFVQRTMWKPNSAYMLFYEQIHPAVVLPKILPEQKKIMPQELHAKVWDSNFKFLMDKNLFDKDYINFLQKVVEIINSSLTAKTIQDKTILKATELALTFFVQTLSHSAEKGTLSQCADLLKEIFTKHPPTSRWFLEKLMTSDWIDHMLTKCHLLPVSAEFCKITAHSVAVLSSIPTNEILKDEPPKVVEEEATSTEKKPKNNLYDSSHLIVIPAMVTPVGKFLATILRMMKGMNKKWRNFENFWCLFEEIAKISREVRKLMFDFGTLRALGHFYLTLDSPWYQGKRPKKVPELTNNEKLMRLNMKHLIGAISVLISGTKVERGVPCQENTEELLELSAEDSKILTQPILLRIISDNSYPEAIVRMVHHLCFENRTNSDLIADTLEEGINRDDNTKVASYWPVFVGFTGIKDSLEQERLQNFVPKYCNVITRNKAYPRLTGSCIYQLVGLVRKILWQDHCFYQIILELLMK